MDRRLGNVPYKRLYPKNQYIYQRMLNVITYQKQNKNFNVIPLFTRMSKI